MNRTLFLIHSGDRTKWCWKYYNYYYQKYFTCQNICDTIFLTENETENFKGVDFVKTGNVNWATGLINFLNDVDYEYIIYQHEDFFLTEKTNDVLAGKLIDTCDKFGLNLLKCCGWWAGYIDENNPMTFVGDDISRFRDQKHSNDPIKIVQSNDEIELWLYSNDSPYLISHQTSIWNREFLLSTLHPGMTPWDHELSGTNILRKRNIEIMAYRKKCPFEYAETLVGGRIRKNAKQFFDIDLGVV